MTALQCVTTILYLCYGCNKDKMMTYYLYLVNANYFIDLTQKKMMWLNGELCFTILVINCGFWSVWQWWLLVFLCAGCEAFSRSGAVHPTEERSRRISRQHESFWRGEWRRRRRWGSRRSQRRGGNHSHTQLPHHLLPFRPGEPTQQVLPHCHSRGEIGKERNSNGSHLMA